jgi:dihydrolipoamide dehydrogenase
MFPFEDKRVMDSTDALMLDDIPKRMLVVGGGIIGLEMATIYDALGSEITIVELGGQIIPVADKDIVTPLLKKIKKNYANVFLNTKVTKMTAAKKGIKVQFEGKNAPESDTFDKVLVAVGRTPNGLLIDAEKAGINIDKSGFISTNNQMKTNIDNIFAIGDIVGQPMLAHKATHEAKVAAEVISGQKAGFDALTIPSVAYTDPEIAWTGKTEKELTEAGVKFTKGVFPWAASGKSLSIGRSEGISKGLFDAESGKILGMGICGNNAGDLISEASLAIEMGCDMSDIALTIHAHPTLSETTAFAAEMAEGTITDLMPPRKKK